MVVCSFAFYVGFERTKLSLSLKQRSDLEMSYYHCRQVFTAITCISVVVCEKFHDGAFFELEETFNTN